MMFIYSPDHSRYENRMDPDQLVIPADLDLNCLPMDTSGFSMTMVKDM